MQSEGTPKFKPKFAPKPQTKKEVGEVKDARSQEQPKAAAPSSSGSIEKGTHDPPRSNRGRGEDRGGRQVKGRAGAGRGQWSVPMGQLYFSGGAAAAAVGSSNSGHLLASARAAAPSTATISGNRHKSSNNNNSNDISGRQSSTRPNESTDNLVQLKDESRMDNEEGEEEGDSDSDADPLPVASSMARRDSGGTVAWPPFERFEATKPLTLPLDPTSDSIREALCGMPILARPDDYQTLKEEEESLFMFQFPQALNLQVMLESAISMPAVKSEDAVPGEPMADIVQGATCGAVNKPKLGANGRLGKLQLLADGSTRLILDRSEECYDVHGGLLSSSWQSVAAVGQPRPGQEGTLHMLGTVTRRLVITQPPNAAAAVAASSSSTAYPSKAQREKAGSNGSHSTMLGSDVAMSGISYEQYLQVVTQPEDIMDTDNSDDDGADGEYEDHGNGSKTNATQVSRPAPASRKNGSGVGGRGKGKGRGR